MQRVKKLWYVELAGEDEVGTIVSAHDDVSALHNARIAIRRAITKRQIARVGTHLATPTCIVALVQGE